MSKLTLSYPLPDGTTLQIPADVIRALRDDLNELLPPPEPTVTGTVDYHEEPLPLRTMNPTPFYRAQGVSVPPTADGPVQE